MMLEKVKNGKASQEGNFLNRFDLSVDSRSAAKRIVETRRNESQIREKNISLMAILFIHMPQTDTLSFLVIDTSAEGSECFGTEI